MRTKGVVLSFLGILALSPDSLLIRSIGVDVFTLVFWRGTLMAVGLTVGIAVAYRSGTWEAFRSVGMIGWVTAAILAAGTLMFVLAIRYTAVSNVLIIMGITPLLSAVLSLLFLREAIAGRTWVAIVVALGAIWITVSGNVERGTWSGDGFALVAAVFVASQVVVIRWAREVNLVPSVAVGGVLVALVSLPFASPVDVTMEDAVLLCALGLVVLPTAFGLLTLAPRYLPAPEVSLIKLSEMVLGPLWVWMALGEEPEREALIGGGILMVTLVVHSVLGQRVSKSIES